MVNVFRPLNKLSSDLTSALHQYCGHSDTLSFALRILDIQFDDASLGEELENQIAQYGPDTTVGELLKMAKQE